MEACRRRHTFTMSVSQGLMPSSTCNEDQSVFAAEGSTSSALGSRGELHCLQAPRWGIGVSDCVWRSWAEQGAGTTFAKFTKLQSAQRQSSTTCCPWPGCSAEWASVDFGRANSTKVRHSPMKTWRAATAAAAS
jgi:hypothetical protein